MRSNHLIDSTKGDETESVLPQDKYTQRAKKFYENYQPAKTAAVVETVFRKPKTYANLHEYDDEETIDQVPTAIGFNSFDSADEVIAAKMKSRYDFTERQDTSDEKQRENTSAVREQNLKKEEIDDEKDKTGTEEMVPFHNVVLKKVSHFDKLSQRSGVSANCEGNSSPEASTPGENEIVKENKSASEATTSVEEANDNAHDADRYGLEKSAWSEDDSCPPVWKSFSEDDNDSTKTKEADRAKIRREIAIAQAKRLHTLNSIPNQADNVGTIPVTTGLDPRLCPNSGNPSISSKKTKASWLKFGKRKNKKRDNTTTVATGTVEQEESSPSPKNQSDPVSVVSNSIIASRQTRPVVGKVSVVTDNLYEQASYGSEGQSKSSDEAESQEYQDSQKSVPASAEQTFAAYVYEGLQNITSATYWWGEPTQGETGRSQDESAHGSESTKSFEQNLKLDATGQSAAKQLSRGSLSPKKRSVSMVSEISIPTSALKEKGTHASDDEVSILGLDKQGSKHMQSDNTDENEVPQKMTKRGKGKVFGKILGRKTVVKV